jgi:D-sedoheptulose 7-phosphate isomerase
MADPSSTDENTMTLLARNLREHLDLFNQLQPLDEPVERAGELITQVLADGGKLMLCGNGGSAADCQHIAAELTGRFIKDRRPLAAIALTTDTSALTCIGNDYSFDDVFVRPLQGLARAGDCLLAVSTSGNSANVLRAVDAARELGVRTIGLLGRDGGKLASRCDLSLIVPSQVTARIQEAHILIGHTLCNIIEARLGLD